MICRLEFLPVGIFDSCLHGYLQARESSDAPDHGEKQSDRVAHEGPDSQEEGEQGNCHRGTNE